MGLKLVGEDENIMVITNNGTIIRVASNDISTIGRGTQGVRIMRIDEGSTVSKIAITPECEEESEETAPAENSEE